MNKNDQSYIDFEKEKEKVKNSIFLRFNYIERKSEEEKIYNKIITYYKKEYKKELLSTIDVSHNKYFD